MRHYHRLNDLHIDQSWVTIGIFDGVHLGHQILIKDMVTRARSVGVTTGVITFYPHPVEILHGLKEPIYLTNPDDRAELIGQLGVDFVLTINFTKRFSNKTAEEFLTSLKSHLGIKGLWAGSDFALGKSRSGDIEKLRALGIQMDFFVEESQKISLGEAAVSSSLIRHLIKEGNILEANQHLGRYYSLDGKVITGNKRGKTLGFPTANIQPWNKQILPPNGVYATIASWNQKKYRSVTNIGLKPTFRDGPARPVVEAYIFDFKENIYGQPLSIEFVECLRKEQKFSSPQDLVEQIHIDIRKAEEALTHVP